MPDLGVSLLAPVYPAILSKNPVFNLLAFNLDEAAHRWSLTPD
jgi:hypothetical protein